MEGVAAVGLASNIIQLVQVACSIGQIVKDLRKDSSNLSSEAKQLRTRAQRVREDVDTIFSKKQITDTQFKSYAEDLQQRVNAYLTALDDTILKNYKKLFGPWITAYKIWRKKDELAELLRRVDEMGTQVTEHIIRQFLPHISFKLDDLSTDFEKIGSNVTGKMEDLQQKIKDLNSQGGKVESLLVVMRDWFKEDGMRKLHRGCLRSLYFQDIDDRTSAVASAHKSTFRWILDGTTATETPDSRTNKGIFSEWLQSEDAVKNWFWISGKPGSGKSTIVKYLATHDSLKDHAKVWSRDRDIVIAHYFFWRFGSDLQRSMEGLFRTLLYRVLYERQDLITKVFPEQKWVMIGSSYRFSEDDLRSGLKRLLKLGVERDICFLLFIDGLDEFGNPDQRDHKISVEADILQPLRTLYDYRTTKICLSSRPWGGFQDEFAQNDRRCFYMEDLTRADIEKYVKDEFNENMAFQDLSARDDGYNDLPTEIVDAAEGVFLWVSLATRSLLDGVTERDTLPELKRRLQELPRKLEDLYDHIMESIYRKNYHLVFAALLFMSSNALLLLAARVPLYLFLFYDQRGWERTLSAQDYTLKAFLDKMEIMRERMLRQSKGLLVIDRTSDDLLIFDTSRLEVRVTHRTFLEYLQRRQVQDTLYGRVSVKKSEGVPARVALRKIFFKSITNLWDYVFHINDNVQDPYFLVRGDSTLINQVSDSRGFAHRGGVFSDGYDWIHSQDPSGHFKFHSSYWGEMQRGLDRKIPYVGQNLSHSSVLARVTCGEYFYSRPSRGELFVSVLAVMDEAKTLEQVIREQKDNTLVLRICTRCMCHGIYVGLWDVVETALTNGVDPNQFDREYETTLWAALIQNIYNVRWKELEYGTRDAVLSFLKHGADTTATFDLYYHSDGKTPQFDYFGRVRTELEDREEGDKTTFNTADGVRHIFATSDVDVERYLPENTDERETPQEFFARQCIPDFLDPAIWKEHGFDVEKWRTGFA